MFHTSMNYKRLLVLLLLICRGDCMNVDNSCEAEEHESSDNLNKLVFVSNYNSALRPLSGTGIPLVVDCEFHIITLSHVDVKKMTTGFLLWLHLKWEEPRLRNNSTLYELTSVFTENNNFLWIPKVIFNPAYKTEVIKGMAPAVSLEVHKKTIIMWTLMSVEFYCSMDLSYYPFDVQTCKLELLSSSLLHSDLILRSKGIKPYNSTNIPELASEYSLKIRELDYDHSTIYSRLIWELTFTRMFLGHLYSTFIPSVMFVLISSLSLLIPIRNLQPRMTVQITTILTIVAVSNNIKADLPVMNVPVRAIDLWFLSCFSFGFLNLIITIVTTALISSASKSHDNQLKREKMEKVISFLENNSLVPILIMYGLFVLFYCIFYLVSSGRI